MTPVVSDRTWVLEAPVERVWDALAGTDRYGQWWPWLRRFEAPGGLVVGAEWRCIVKPPLPYVVELGLAIDEVVAPELVRATVGGDLDGTARLDLRPVGPATSTLRLRSTLRPVRRPLVLLDLVAGPLTRWGHDWVLSTGLRQFADHVAPRP